MFLGASTVARLAYHKWADRKGLVYAETIRRLEFSFREASEFLSVFLLLGRLLWIPARSSDQQH